LREVLARADHDFLFPDPGTRSRRPNRRRSLWILQLARQAAAHPNRLAAILFAGLVVAICVNALELQQTRHPAPLFHMSFAPYPPPAKPRALTPSGMRVVPLPPRDPIAQLLQSTGPKPARPATKPSAEAKPSRDPITQLLKEDDIAPQPDKSVLAAQRALVELGFVLEPDGIEGDATRRAIEQFERDHGLPVRAELTPKVLHELSVRSGISIE
jgi:Putative peptidoglycan binding domain